MPSSLQLRRIQAALRQSTECFAAQLHSPGEQTPAWDEFEWTIAMATAVLHGVSPLMATALRWQGPRQWQRFLHEQREHTAIRHARLLSVLESIDQLAQKDAVPFIALKGCALHAIGLYRGGERPMADIDLLVQPSMQASLLRVLHGLGYRESVSIDRHVVLEPQKGSITRSLNGPAFGEREDAIIKIEVHTHICERIAVTDLDVTRQILTDRVKPGLNLYPSPVALMMHLLLHAAGNMVGRALRLIQLVDIARLSSTLSMCEWEQLQALRVAGRSPWWALPVLQLVERYFPGSIPAAVLSQLSLGCPRSLVREAQTRRLADVSYAALQRVALPALSWTSSWTEKVRYVRTRLLPTAQMRDIHRLVSRERWAQESQWARSGQLRRLLWHALKRPPRLQPMFIVNAALRTESVGLTGGGSVAR